MADKHPDKHQVRLGAAQETLFITLAARARETRAGPDRGPVPRGPDRAGHLPEADVRAAAQAGGQEGLEARWAWACDDPRSLERLGLEVRQSATITRPPRAMRAQLPFGYRYLVPLADPVAGKAMTLTLFRASSPAAGGQDATARAAGAA